MKLSVVIITKNEAHIIANTLQSLEGLSDDIIIVDNGSTDDTIPICKKFNTRIIETVWEGYGKTKNKGVDAAIYDWILSLDADEAVDNDLKEAINQASETDDAIVYAIRFKNFFCGKYIRFGEWAGDKHTRLFNRKKVKWNDDAVHETLLMPVDARKKDLKGNILHYTTQSIDEHTHKSIHYAKLNAQKYFLQGRKVGFFKLYFGPMFNFLRNYVFGLGFLDGYEGYLIAKSTAWYTFMKYVFLREMIRRNNNEENPIRTNN